jgi:hypothetical protein
VSAPFVNPIPFARGYRIVYDRDLGVLVVEQFNELCEEWIADRMFPCTNETEALGIAMAYSGQVSSHIDVNALVARMTNRPVRLPGDLFITMMEALDGSYFATVESRGADGARTVSNYREDARSFFEAYGWALAEARTVIQGNL